MKRIVAVVWLVLCIASILLQGQIGIVSSEKAKLRAPSRQKPNTPTAQRSPSVRQRPFAQNVTWSQCPPEAENFGASCG